MMWAAAVCGFVVGASVTSILWGIWMMDFIPGKECIYDS